MRFLRLLIVLLSAGVLLTAVGWSNPAAAQDKQTTTQTDTSKTDTTTTGFLTGTTCTKSGIYQASNQYLTVIIVVEDGAEFPPFVDGQKITWYTLKPSPKSSFDAVKVSPGSN